ncbi:hypothetical protein CWI66_11600 [Halomonas sp. 141]|nr:hypothetical protein CWI66_11600 [Halomonas sp. 141]
MLISQMISAEEKLLLKVWETQFLFLITLSFMQILLFKGIITQFRLMIMLLCVVDCWLKGMVKVLR